jgi:hypothetical protein
VSDFFLKFESELHAAARRELARRRRRRWSWRALGPRRLAVAIVAIVVGAGVAAARTDLLPIGSQVPVKDVATGPYEPKRLGPRVVVATGRTPILGRWQMFWSRSSAGECEALQFIDERRPGGGASIGEGCGGPSGLTVGALIPVPGGGTPLETVVHGRAPEDTAAVRVSVPGLGATPVDVQEGPADVPGDWYLAAFPGVPSKGTAKVERLDGHGKPQGPAADLPITLHPRYPSPEARYVGGSELAVSPGGLVEVPLACHRQPHREGKCMGTLSLRLAGRHERCCGSTRGRRYGWQYYRLSPLASRRLIRLRLSERTRGLLARHGRLPARLRVSGGTSRRVMLVAPE